MKNITSSLTALFATRQYAMAGLYQFDLVTGTSIYYCSGDVDILLTSSQSGGDPFWNNQRFLSNGLLFDRKDNRAKLEQKIGTEVSTLVFDVIPNGALVQGGAFLTDIRQGVFDGAVLTYLSAYWNPSSGYVNPLVPTGTIKKFVGRVAEVDCGRNLATFTINSHLELLNMNMPRNIYQPNCNNTLFDGGCTLLASSFAVSSAVSSGSTSSTIICSLTPSSGLTFTLGKITFTSGVLNGISRSVKTYVQGIPSTVTVVPPFPAAPSSGDTFLAYPGCDHTLATCSSFGNSSHFRGMPFVPAPETAI